MDKYSAVWVSHSSMGDFLKCPRAYYLHNVYKDPKTGRKITLVNGALSLGQAVHKALEDLKHLPLEERMRRDLRVDFENAWKEVAGERGGFKYEAEESAAHARGLAMIERVIKNPGPIARKTVRLKPSHNDMPPNIVLDDAEGIILCGLVDWIEYDDASDTVRVLDFKTGKNEEDGESLQLPIYLLLLSELQKRPVSGASYWYLEYDDAPREVALPEIGDARERVLAVARQVRAARAKKEYVCPKGAAGCFACKPYEQIVRGEARYIGVGGYCQDTYMI